MLWSLILQVFLPLSLYLITLKVLVRLSKVLYSWSSLNVAWSILHSYLVFVFLYRRLWKLVENLLSELTRLGQVEKLKSVPVGVFLGSHYLILFPDLSNPFVSQILQLLTFQLQPSNLGFLSFQKLIQILLFNFWELEIHLLLPALIFLG